jgi:hypothetical protein
VRREEKRRREEISPPRHQGTKDEDKGEEVEGTRSEKTRMFEAVHLSLSLLCFSSLVSLCLGG